jgi:hypothetical protein
MTKTDLCIWHESLVKRVSEWNPLLAAQLEADLAVKDVLAEICEKPLYCFTRSESALDALQVFEPVETIVMRGRLEGRILGRSQTVSVIEAGNAGAVGRAEVPNAAPNSAPAQWTLSLSDNLEDRRSFAVTIRFTDGTVITAGQLQLITAIGPSVERGFISAIARLLNADCSWKGAALMWETMAVLYPDAIWDYLPAVGCYLNMQLPEKAAKILQQAKLIRRSNPSPVDTNIADLQKKTKEEYRRTEAAAARYVREMPFRQTLLEQIEAIKHLSLEVDLDYFNYCLWRIYYQYFPPDPEFLILFSKMPYTSQPLLAQTGVFFGGELMRLFPNLPESQEGRIVKFYVAARYDSVLQSYREGRLPLTSRKALWIVVRSLHLRRRQSFYLEFSRLADRLKEFPEMDQARRAIASFSGRRFKRRMNLTLNQVRAAGRLGRASRLKVALCLSGQLRGFECALPTIREQIVEKYDATVFLSTWREIGCAVGAHCQRLWRSLPPKFGARVPYFVTFDSFKEHFPCTYNLLTKSRTASADRIQQLLPGAIFEIEEDLPLKHYLGDDPAIVTPNFTRLLYKRYRTGKLLEEYEREHRMSFDVVFWCRPDTCIRLLSLPPLEKLRLDVAGTHFRPLVTASDHFHVGGRKGMGLLLELWERRKQLYGWPPGDPFSFCLFNHGLMLLDLGDIGGRIDLSFVNPQVLDEEFKSCLLEDMSRLPAEALEVYRPAIDAFLKG